jgi:hypothetical protein
VCCLRLEGSWRCHHIELIASHGLTIVRLRINRRIKRKFYLLDILTGLCRYGLNRRTEVIDHVVVGDDIRDVLSLTDDLNVSLRRLNELLVARFMPMSVANKNVSSRSYVIIRVGPGRYWLLLGDVCFGRKRSPANVFVTFSP